MKRQTQRPVQLWLASTNSGKLREFREAALAHGIEVKSLPGIDSMLPCIEDGLTFEENARKKAIHYSRAFDGLVFADDSGLCVDALGGAPGVFSARYAGEGAADETNNARLIAELCGRRASASSSLSGGPLSSAYYDCAVALALGGRVLITSEGRAYGAIIEHPRGLGGFGYDPHFYYPPLGHTFAELTPEAKFAVSHRGEAFRRLLDAIERWTPGEPPQHRDKSPVIS
jgi:XTP/dITP diphosphohydrolase